MDVFTLGVFYAHAIPVTNFSISNLFIVLFVGAFSLLAWFLPTGYARFNSAYYKVLLALCWLSGLLCGCFLVCRSGSNLVSMMLGAGFGPLSIVASFCTAFIPFLFSFFVVFISRPLLLYPICFLKAFLFSFAFAGFSYTFGTAGWLYSFLILFCDLLSAPLLYFYWSRHICGSNCFSAPAAAMLLSLLLLIGSIGHRFIAPVLRF